MSQAKVEQYKQQKAGRKNWKKEQMKKKIIAIASSAAVIVILAVALVCIFHKDYGEVNTGSSIYDDAALASIVGYDGYTLTDVINELDQ